MGGSRGERLHPGAGLTLSSHARLKKAHHNLRVRLRVLSHLRIAVRVYLLLALAAFGILICAAIGLWTLRIQMIEDRRVQIENVLNLVLAHARSDMKEKGGPRSEAGRAAFLEMIRSTKYGGDSADYFFVLDYNGVALVHPDPNRQGRSQFGTVYEDGEDIARKFVDIAQSPRGSGFVEYSFPRPSTGMTTRKLAHVHKVPELNVLVGLGVYIEDVDAVMLDRLKMEAWLFLVTMPAVALFAWVISRSITEPLSRILGKIMRLAGGDLDLPSASARDKSELGDVDEAVDILRGNAIVQQELQKKVREQNELLTKQRDDAEQSAKAKAEFLSIMSHELRTPLHAILSYSKIGLKAAEESNPAKTRKCFETIRLSGKRLVGILNDILNLAKMDAGAIEYNRERCDFRSIVDQTLTELAPLIEEKKLNIRIQLQSKDMDAVCDRLQIIQVLMNLISNAIKFSAEGSQIAIRLSDERAADGEAGLCCRVSDEGCGIPEDELELVFNRFVQGSKNKKSSEGSGLGLTICKKIVAAHGGRIWAENAMPKGAIFTFVIPKGEVRMSQAA
jgi:signal transduction histidine kinase